MREEYTIPQIEILIFNEETAVALSGFSIGAFEDGMLIPDIW